MEADLKALHRAVNALLKARRAARRTAKAAGKARQNRWGMCWERQHYADELAQPSDVAQTRLQQAEAEVLTWWEALNSPVEQPPADVTMP